MANKFISSVEIDGSLTHSKHRVIKHTDAAQELAVTVVSKSVKHPEYSNGSTAGFVIDGVEGAYLELTPGITYKFDQSNSSNANHPLRFYLDKDKVTSYTTGVTTSGTPGGSGAYTQIIPTTSTPPVLFYQCSNHSLMGSYAKFGTGTVGDTYSIDVTQDGGNVDLKLDAANGTDSTVQLTAGSNVTLTRNNANAVTIAAAAGLAGITVQEEGTSLTTAATALNFTGSAITASGSGATKTINVTGGAITVQEEGAALSTAATTINFVGSGVTASGTGTTKTITVTGGGGGGGAGEIVKQTFSATGSASFTLSDAIADVDNVNVYVSGVYQYPSNYTVSGNTVTFVSGSIPTAGTNNVHIRHNVTAPTLTEGSAFSTSGNLVGDGTATTFALGGSPRSSDHTMVFLEGVYQEKENYSISGSNIIFTTAPPNGYSVEVKYVSGVLDLTNVGEIILDELTGDGTATYALSVTPQSENYTNVYIEGVYQEKGTYSVSGANITFSSNVPTGYSIEASTTRTIASGSVTPTTFATDTFIANGSSNNFTLVNGSPSSKSLTMVFIQGVYQAKSNYNLVSGEIQFTAGTPSASDAIEVISISAINTAGSPVTSVNGEVGAVTVASKHGVSVISANATAVANTLYVLTANLNLTLPASPTAGDSIKISNRSNVITCQLLRNGSNILGAAVDLTLDTAAASFELVYTDTANGWIIIGQ